MNTITLWNVPVSVAKKVLEHIRQEAVEKMSDPDFSFEEMREFLYHAEDIEGRVKAAEKVHEEDEDDE